MLQIMCAFALVYGGWEVASRDWFRLCIDLLSIEVHGVHQGIADNMHEEVGFYLCATLWMFTASRERRRRRDASLGTLLVGAALVANSLALVTGLIYGQPFGGHPWVRVLVFGQAALAAPLVLTSLPGATDPNSQIKVQFVSKHCDITDIVQLFGWGMCLHSLHAKAFWTVCGCALWFVTFLLATVDAANTSLGDTVPQATFATVLFSAGLAAFKSPMTHLALVAGYLYVPCDWGAFWSCAVAFCLMHLKDKYDGAAKSALGLYVFIVCVPNLISALYRWFKAEAEADAGAGAFSLESTVGAYQRWYP